MALLRFVVEPYHRGESWHWVAREGLRTVVESRYVWSDQAPALDDVRALGEATGLSLTMPLYVRSSAVGSERRRVSWELGTKIVPDRLKNSSGSGLSATDRRFLRSLRIAVDEDIAPAPKILTVHRVDFPAHPVVPNRTPIVYGYSNPRPKGKRT